MTSVLYTRNMKLNEICLKSLVANALTGIQTQDHLMPKFIPKTMVLFIHMPLAFLGVMVAMSTTLK